MSVRAAVMIASTSVALGAVAPAGAEPVRGVRSTDVAPIAVRGGVLMVPLEAERDGDGWPQVIELKPIVGDPIVGLVAWVYPVAPTRTRQWSSDPRGLAVRAVEPTDDSAEPAAGSPFLLAPLPHEGSGPLRLGVQTLHPRWRDHANPPVGHGWPARRALELSRGPDRPDPDSPFEYWRWVLLAERLGMEPPPVHTYGPAGELVAMHYAELWMLGLARLAEIDPGAAERCRDLLTEICLDGSQPFAAWVIDPATVGGLLALLLNDDRPAGQIAEAAREWADYQDVIVIRTGSPRPGHVAVAIANPLGEPIAMRFQWVGERRLAAAATLEPGRLTRVVIPQPADDAPGAPTDLGHREAQVHVLIIDSAGRQQRMTFRVGDLPARPPGFAFTALRQPMTLAEAEAGWQPGLSPQRATTAQFRKIGGRWELFIECRRPNRSQSSRDLMAVSGLQDLRGVEAVTVLFGDLGGGPILTVPETGWHRVFRGDHDGTLEVHRRSYHDRWFCRVVVPESWLTEAGGRVVRIGLVRTHGDGAELETAPYATLPWAMDPGRAPISLDTWDDLAP
jgi:hypothetical protein